MDTHVASYSEFEPGLAGISARLPGEAHVADGASAAIGKPDAGEGLSSSVAKPRRRRRGKLLGGGAVIALFIAGCGFLVSPYNTVYPVPGLQAWVTGAANDATRYAQTNLRPLLAPAASLAKVTVPSPPPATREAYTPKPRDQQVAELLSLHPGAAAPGQPEHPAGPGADAHPAKTGPDHAAPKPTPTVAAVPAVPAVQADTDVPAGYVPREPGSLGLSQASPAAASPPTATNSDAPAIVPPPKDATALVIASLPQAQSTPQDAQAAPIVAFAPTPAAVPQANEAHPVETPPAATKPAAARPAETAAPAAAPAARDAPSEAANLRAGPMSPPEQVQVLNLVTEMAAMVKDLRKQQAQLRSDLGKSTTDVSARLMDYERRLALAEARSAVTAADDTNDAAPAQPIALASEPFTAAPKTTAVAARSVAVVPSPLLPATPKVFRVQAASPGLALLAQVDRGGGDGAQLQVIVGDTVPDYGRVKSIAQKGTAWIVTTERGDIR